MNNTQVTRQALSGFAAALLLVFGVNIAVAGGKAQLMVGANGMMASSAAAGVKSMQLTVADPAGRIVYSERSKGDALQWSPSAGAMDGLYTYEVRVTTDGQSEVRGGRVRVQGGVLQPSTQRDFKMQKGRRGAALDRLESMFANALMWALDALVPPAAAQGPTDTVAGVSATNGDYIAGNNGFGDGSVQGWWGVNHAAGEEVLADVHVLGDLPFIDFQDNVNGPPFVDDWGFGAAGGVLGVADFIGGTFPFGIVQGAPNFSMVIAPVTGDVGFGTITPAAAIHAVRASGGALNMFQLTNDGPIGFNMENTSIAQIWRFAAQTTGFRVSLDGTGGPEFEVTNAGELIAGPGGLANLVLDVGGNLTLAGAANATAFNVVSDRNRKENFVKLNGKEVLAKLTTLPVTEWSFKGDPVRHIGPTAQDFKAAFGLGTDDKHIALKDVAGVALLGVQELHRMIEDRDARIAELERRLAAADARETRLRALEAAMSQLLAARPPEHLAVALTR